MQQDFVGSRCARLNYLPILVFALCLCACGSQTMGKEPYLVVSTHELYVSDDGPSWWQVAAEQFTIVKSFRPREGMFGDRSLLFHDARGRMWSLDASASTSRLIHETPRREISFGYSAWCPDGTMLFDWLGASRQLVSWSVDENEPHSLGVNLETESDYKGQRWISPGQRDKARRVVADSELGLLVLSQSDDGYTWRVLRGPPTEDGEWVRLFPEWEGVVSSWSYEPHQKKLVAAVQTLETYGVVAHSLDGLTERSAISFDTPIEHVQAVANGGCLVQLASKDGEGLRWLVLASDLVTVTMEGSGKYARFNKDGSMLAYCLEGGIVVADVAGAEEVCRIELARSPEQADRIHEDEPYWSPDSRCLAFGVGRFGWYEGERVLDPGCQLTCLIDLAAREVAFIQGLEMVRATFSKHLSPFRTLPPEPSDARR